MDGIHGKSDVSGGGAAFRCGAFGVSDAVLAVLASALFPGAGQAFERRYVEGSLFLVAVLIWGLLFMPIGYAVYGWNVIDALVCAVKKCRNR